MKYNNEKIHKSPLAGHWPALFNCAVGPEGSSGGRHGGQGRRELLVLVYPVLGYVGPILFRPRRLQELRTSAESMEAQFTEVGERV